jgi:hypothetical protein
VEEKGNGAAVDHESNPRVRYDAVLGIAPNRILDLPADAATGIDHQYFQGYSPKTQEILITRQMEEPVCAQVDVNSAEPVFAV